jgi:hypothetical protein
VSDGAVLGVGGGVGRDLGPAGVLEARGEDVEALLVVAAAIGGGGVGAGDAREDAVDGGADVVVFPTRGEEVVPVESIRLTFALATPSLFFSFFLSFFLSVRG